MVFCTAAMASAAPSATSLAWAAVSAASFSMSCMDLKLALDGSTGVQVYFPSAISVHSHSFPVLVLM